MKLAFKIGLSIIAVLAFLMIGLYLFVQSDKGQSFVSSKTNEILSTQFPDAKIEIGKISYHIPDYIELENTYFGNNSLDTIASVRKVSVDMAMFKLIFGTIKVDEIAINDAIINVNRPANEKFFNYEKALSLSKSNSKEKEETSSSSLAFDIGSVSLRNVALGFNDTPGGILFNSQFDQLDVDISAINPNANAYILESIVLNGGFAKTKISQSTLVEADTTNSSLPQIDLSYIEIQSFGIDFEDEVLGISAKTDLGSLTATFEEINLTDNKVVVDEFTVNNTSISVATFEGETSNGETSSAEGSKPWSVSMNDFKVSNTDFKYDNLAQPKLAHSFDPNHIEVANTTLTLQNMAYDNDEAIGDLSKLSFVLNEKLALLEAATKFKYTPKGVDLKNLQLRTQGSKIQFDLELRYASIEDLSENLNFKIDAAIRKSSLSLAELNKFIPSISQEIDSLVKKDKFLLDAEFNGSAKSLNIKKFKASVLDDSKILFSGHIENFNNPDIATFNLDNINLTTSKKELRRLSTLRDSLGSFNLPEYVSIEGNAKGSTQQMDLALSLKSNFINGILNATVVDPFTPQNLSASGDLHLTDTHPNKISPSLEGLSLLASKLDFNVEKGGKEFNVNAAVDSMIYESYLYTDVSLSTDMIDSLLNFSAKVNDPNLAIDLRGNTDLAKTYLPLNMRGSLRNLNLQNLNLDTYSETISCEYDISMNSIDLARLGGSIELKNLNIGKVSTESAEVKFKSENGLQITNIESPFLQAELTGDYNYGTLPSYFTELSEQLLYKGGAPKANKYFENIDLKILAEQHPIWDKLIPGLKFEDRINLSGQLKPNTSTFDLSFSDLAYLDFEASKFKSSFVLNENRLDGNGEAELISYGTLKTQNTGLSFQGPLDDLNYSFETFTTTGEPLITNGNISIANDELMVSIYDIKINNEVLTSNKSAIIYSGEKLTINNFILTNTDQSIKLNTTNENLEVSISNLKVGQFWEMLGNDEDTLEANLNSELLIKDFLGDYSLKGDMSLTNIKFNTLENGEFYLTIKGLNDEKSILEGELLGLKSNLFFDGEVSFKEVNTLKINCDIKRLDAALIETLAESYLSNVEGLLEGKIMVKGAIDNPIINGTFDFYKFKFNTPYLGTDLRIANKSFSVKNNIAVFENFTLQDSLNQPLTLNGKVNFADFEKAKYNLAVKTKNFHLLDAQKGDNELYYGTANIDADLRIKGVNDEPSVDGKLSLNKSSKLTFIMPTSIESTESEGIVTFVPPASVVEESQIDTTTNKPSFTSNFISEIALQISTDPEATINIIIDQVTGDNLTVKGKANLTAGTDLNGDIFLAGKYEVSSGFYNFSLPPIIKRKFQLEKGGTITWSGDPYKAEVNLRAFYEVNTDIQSLNTFGLNVDRYGRTPIDVLLNIGGTVEKPEVSFDLRSSASAENSIKSLIEQKNIFGDLRRNTSAMNRQALSLLVTNSFFTEDTQVPILAGISGEAIARQSASKLLTDQLNTLAGDVLANSGLSFGLNSTQIKGPEGDEYKTDFNIGFNKSLFNNRIKVSAGKNFELENSTDVSQNSTELLDNLEVSYFITPDGKYILKIYRDNEFQTILEGFVLETGVSFILSSEYNKLKELFKK